MAFSSRSSCVLLTGFFVISIHWLCRHLSFECACSAHETVDSRWPKADRDPNRTTSPSSTSVLKIDDKSSRFFFEDGRAELISIGKLFFGCLVAFDPFYLRTVDSRRKRRANACMHNPKERRAASLFLVSKTKQKEATTIAIKRIKRIYIYICVCVCVCTLEE